MKRLSSLLVMTLAMPFVGAGCSSDDGAVDQIHGTWFWEPYSAYEQLAEDGTWGVWFTAGLAGDAHDWGTYTFDGETLVYSNAEDSWCPGSVATWTVEFSNDGQESRQTFVEDTCTRAGIERGQDRVLVRQTP